MRRSLFRLAVVVAIVLVAGLLLAMNVLRVTQAQIDSLNPQLPDYRQIMASRQAHLPTAIHFLPTASRSIARDLVLNAQQDSMPKGEVDLSFPAFVLTWSDGRRFVIDGGLEANPKGSFLRLVEWLVNSVDGQPMLYQQALHKRLDVASIQGLGLTHLHKDHTAGLKGLCAAGAQMTTYQTVEQFTMQNYLTFGGDDDLAAMTCSTRLVLAEQDSLLRDVQGFPGLFLVHVAGHTPGSQVFIAHVRRPTGVTTYVIGGDIANHQDGVTHNIGKPFWYSRWLVPENLAQMRRLREWLKSLASRHQLQVLLSHDLRALNDSGVPALD